MEVKEKNFALLVAGGEDLPEPERITALLKEASYTICADRGFDRVRDYKEAVDLVVGDFDSSSSLADPVSRRALEESGIRYEVHPSHKDDTDSELALKILKEKGYNKVIFIGGTGSRLDHSFSNILLIEAYSKRGMDIRLETENNQIRFLPVGSHRLDMPTEPSTYISFFTLDPGIQLTLRGFEYDLEDFHLRPGTSRAVSNHLLIPDNEILIKGQDNDGIYCFYSRDGEE